MIFRLDDDPTYFPDPRLGDDDGLFAVGGDLSVDRLLLAYSDGIFPWYSFRDETEIMWWCPMKRFVIMPSEIHISHSMRTLMRKELYTCTIDRDFDRVIDYCGKLRINEQGAWLGKEMTEAYKKLHDMGFAHSVEVWDNDKKLVGGLYGVGIGTTFCGESMFSLVPSASKLALIHLARFLENNGGKMIDCQFETPHLKSMGGRYIDYDEYLKLIWDETE